MCGRANSWERSELAGSKLPRAQLAAPLLDAGGGGDIIASLREQMGGRVRISRRWLLAILLGLVAFLEIMHLFPGAISHTIQNRFDLDAEANIPTWYSTILLFMVAQAGLFIYLRARQRAGAGILARHFWLGFTLFYAFLSLDDTARIHEILDSPAVRIKWFYVYAPFTALFFVICVYQLFWKRRAKGETALWILGGLVIYALGGMGMEALNYFFPIPDFWARISIMVEEGLEMICTIGVLTGCLTELDLLT
jgi:hypothetical protein